MGLFHYRAPPAPENVTLEERWHIWVGQEKFRRLGWAVYVCLLCISSRNRNTTLQ
jgi:hypothetical protein